MKKIFLNVFYFLVLFVFVFSFVKAEVIFYEDFNDENLNESYVWKTRNNAYYFSEGKLNADGVVDNVGRYGSQFDYFINFSADNLVFSFDGLLKSNGNLQEGRGITVSLVGPGGRYDLRILNGVTSGFPINYYTISFGYGDNSLHDLVTTNFVPDRDFFYNLKAVRINWTWYFYVNDELIGITQDNLKITKIVQIHVPCVGSVIIDNINITNLKQNNETNSSQDSSNKIDEGLLKYAPVFYLHPEEYYEPREIYSMMNLSNLKKENQQIKNAPIFFNDIENLSSSYYLDLINVDITDYNYPSISDFENFKPVIYGRAVSKNNRKHYQYFIFYPFQKRNLISHEGDWELVQVNENGAGKIESVEYFFDLWKLVYYDLGLIEFVNKTHPVVYVALGSHNNYANNDEVDFNNPYMYFQKFLSKVKGLEKISQNGKIYKPIVLKNDFSFNENLVFYEIKDIREVPLNFNGHWGQLSPQVLRRGPKGPSENPRFWRKWNEPENYAYNPELPFFSVFLYSPVNFEIYDDENNLVDEYSENLILLNEEPKAAIVKGNEYKLKLKSYEEGQFSMDAFLYDDITEKGLMVSYKNISTKECSDGYLDVNFDSYFVLNYDSDCDKNYEKYLPNENVTLNLEYILPDKDKDGVNDFVDNCVDEFNPDQSEFNGDGLGDACDNPRYYKIKAFNLLEENQKTLISTNNSLNENLWVDDFHINSNKVFLYELYAIQHVTNSDFEYLLAKADKLIVEKLLLENIDMKFKNKHVKEIYEKGLSYMDKQDYKKAILCFMEVWVLIS